jgi:hypothetical protein
MNEAVPMNLADGRRQANGDAQEASHVERLSLVLLKNPIQKLTTRILKYEDRPPLMTSERERLSSPRLIKFGCERVFVLEPPNILRRQLFSGY